MHRCPALVLVFSLALALALAPASRAEEPLSVATVEVARDVTDPLIPQAPPEDLGLSPERPGSVRVLPDGLPLGFGHLAAGGVSHGIALVRTEGATAALVLDRDGDGDYTGSGEQILMRGALVRLAGQEVMRWEVKHVPVGRAVLDFEFLLVVESNGMLLADGQNLRLDLATRPPEGVSLVSASGRVKYATVETSAGRAHFAIVRDESDRVTVLVDGNGNGTLGEAGETFAGPIVQRDARATWWKVDGIPYGRGTASVAFGEAPGPLTSTVVAGTARRGSADLGGVSHVLELLDADLDGRYGSPGDFWWFGPAARLAARKSTLNRDSMVEGDEPVFLAAAWKLVDVDEDGNALLIPVRDAGTLGDYLHRRAERVAKARWSPVFERERAAFGAEHGIDHGRPRATREPPWLYDVNLDAAIARAQAEGKPILVDVEADWCEWCKRFEYYTYPDAEVAQWLSRFVLLRINYEFREGDAVMQRLGVQKLPYIGVLDERGNPLLFPNFTREGATVQASGPPSFEGPQKFVDTLRRAYNAWLQSRGN